MMNCAPLVAAGSEDVFTIRAVVRISASDSYHYEVKDGEGRTVVNNNRSDSCVYLFTGEEKITIKNGQWQSSGSSRYMIGGSGKMKNVSYHYGPPPEPPTEENLSWSYRVDPTAYEPTNSNITFSPDYKFRECSVVPDPVFPMDMSVLSGGYASVYAFSVYMYGYAMNADIFELPTNSMSYTVIRSFSTNMSQMYTNPGESGMVMAIYSSYITIQRNPAELEAVILPDPPPEAPLPKYADWIPEGGKDEDTAGNTFMVRVQIREKGSTEPAKYLQAKFSFALNNTSKEPGVCLNYPPKDKAKNDFDLRFNNNSAVKITDDKGQVGESVKDDLYEIHLVLDSLDYAGSSKLTVTADVLGGPSLKAHRVDKTEQEFLMIPQDDNNNHVADAWEKAENVYQMNLHEDWEEADRPSGQLAKGDGISFFEKYRGFRFFKQHERLSPLFKHIFIYDPDWVVTESLLPDNRISNFQKASNCRLRFVDADEWTGPGDYSAHKRVVNFNHSTGNVCEQHALHVRYINGSTTQPPDDFIANAGKKGVDRDEIGSLIDATITGKTWPDLTSPNKEQCPGGLLVLEIYAAGVLHLARGLVIYNTWGLPQYFTTWEANRFGVMTSSEEYDSMEKEVEKAADEAIAAAPQKFNRLVGLIRSFTITHELAHGMGVADLDLDDGHFPNWRAHSSSCFMRYLRRADYPPDPTDRFGENRTWANEFCHSTLGTAKGRSCWSQIRATDNEKK